MARRTNDEQLHTLQFNEGERLRSGEMLKREWMAMAHNVRQSLIKAYGYGDEPVWRLRFYDKVATTVRERGPVAVELVDALIAACEKGQFPDRLFTKLFLQECQQRSW